MKKVLKNLQNELYHDYFIYSLKKKVFQEIYSSKFRIKGKYRSLVCYGAILHKNKLKI